MCLLLSKSAGLMCPIAIREAVNAFSSQLSMEAAVKAASSAILLWVPVCCAARA